MKGTTGVAKRQFQSTLPYGSDILCFGWFPADVHFNPRSLTGATVHELLHLIIPIISIHAPLRERPLYCVILNSVKNISIHAPLRERLLPLIFFTVKKKISIHAPLRERPLNSNYLCYEFLFQSTLPYGSDNRPPKLLKLR